MRSREQQSSRSLRGEGEGEGDEAPPPRFDHAHQHPNTSSGGCNRRAWCLLALLALLLLSTGSFLLRRTTQVTTTPTTTPQHLQNQQLQQHQLAPPPSDLVIHIILDGNVNGLATRHTSTAAFHRMHLCSVASACATARQYDTIVNDGAQKARTRLGVTPPSDPPQSFTRVRVYYDDEAPSAAAFASPEALIAQLAQETGCQEARLQARALRHAIPSLFFGLPLQGWYGTRAASNSRAAPTTALRHSSALPPQLQRNLQQVGGRSGGSSSQYDATLLTAVQIAIMLKLGGVLVTRDTILLRPSALALPNSLSFQVTMYTHSAMSCPLRRLLLTPISKQNQRIDMMSPAVLHFHAGHRFWSKAMTTFLNDVQVPHAVRQPRAVHCTKKHTHTPFTLCTQDGRIEEVHFQRFLGPLWQAWLEADEDLAEDFRFMSEAIMWNYPSQASHVLMYGRETPRTQPNTNSHPPRHLFTAMAFPGKTWRCGPWLAPH